MKNKISIVAIVLILIFSSFRNEDTGKIYFIRKGMYTGVNGAVKLFIDGKILCELSNNSFSVHAVPVGVHKFNAQWMGKKTKEPSDDNSIEVEIKPNLDYYLQLGTENRGLVTYAILNEITSNTWKKIKDDLKEDDCH